MKKTVYVDVDDTFVRTFGSKRIPMPEIIQKIRILFSAGFELYCWSSGGADYAEKSAKEFGIDDCFIAFLPKPQVMLDDQSPVDWKYLTVLHPNEIEKIEVEQGVDPNA